MLHILLKQWQPIAAVLVLVVFWMWETASPFFEKPKNRVRHAARNLSIAGINAVILGLVFSGITVTVALITESRQLGLLNLLKAPTTIHAVSAFLIIDCWTYCWHRLNHRIPFLWRFHRMHHSDPGMDVTTAVRFHLGEITISSILRLGIIVLIGIPIWLIILYDIVLLTITQFHHANIVLPKHLDRFIRFFIVSPNMHKVHHSRARIETDSNYSSVLSIWDRIFRSYREKENYREIKYGLENYDDDNKQSVKGLLKTPLFKS